MQSDCRFGTERNYNTVSKQDILNHATAVKLRSVIDFHSSVLSNFTEFHAFVLGILHTGLILALWRSHRTVALGLLAASLGITYLNLSIANHVIREKPWYFLAPITTGIVLATGVEWTVNQYLRY